MLSLNVYECFLKLFPLKVSLKIRERWEIVEIGRGAHCTRWRKIRLSGIMGLSEAIFHEMFIGFKYKFKKNCQVLLYYLIKTKLKNNSE